MNVVGRQMSRSSSSSHHQRQYSDHFIETASSNKWLQSSSLSQDFGFYGGVQGSRMSRSLVADPSTPTGSRSSSLRKNGDDQVSASEFSPGLLDLHSLDTELLPEMQVPSIYDGSQLHQTLHGKSFDDSDPFAHIAKLTNRSRGLPENNLLKSFSADKERANNVAKIKVVVRKRPLNKKEIAKKEEDIITIELNSNSLTVHETKLKVDLTEYVEKHEFVFDAVLNEDVPNDEVYSETVEPIVPLIFHKTKATCFAYGQTGSGKTYTMQPLPLEASQDILRLMHHTYRNQGFQLFVSFFEIYGGKLFDLLNDRKKLCMREDGKQQVCIVGLQEYRVSNVETIKELIEKGNATRSTGTTGANEESSRSHAILQLCIKRSADGSESKPARLVGKLSFIDLAGSERGADTTDNDKQTRMEGAEINKSLLALKECIRALDNDQGHIPFRGSKLTEVLRDSFVGDSRTVMISCISPSSGSCEHTLNTLRYADRVKSLSKGNSSRRDPLSSTSNLRESTALPLSSALPAESIFEDNITSVANDKNRFGWPKQIETEPSPPFNVDSVPSGRIEGSLPASVYSDYYKGQRGGQSDIAEDDFDYSEQTCEQEKPSRMNNKKLEAYQRSVLDDKRKIDTQVKWRDMADFEANNSHADDDLTALLKQEEEDLVTAHRRQVEETIDIVREEMDLLVEADQPGNQLDDYISKLNAILSQKAAGILQLQTQLAQFQRRLNEYHVLVSSSN
ncbi:kinesin-like protein KIN-13B isoform X1 [Juglans microcarpa x Juglans regia]|uniref:kinesin-like protein KIN-13B isoform X1 n=1 Tax=Juglans microcarpa x Juglans regia TaxID=2249226 RepID=UPI001B7EBCF1|nr:kinesin-like protein KIN-13B isoform X1 [Juglans microcarpa x Juglans regia]